MAAGAASPRPPSRASPGAEIGRRSSRAPQKLERFSANRDIAGARSATTPTGTASLKLNRDPLGSQFLNDSADGRE